MTLSGFLLFRTGGGSFSGNPNGASMLLTRILSMLYPLHNLEMFQVTPPIIPREYEKPGTILL